MEKERSDSGSAKVEDFGKSGESGELVQYFRVVQVRENTSFYPVRCIFLVQLYLDRSGVDEPLWGIIRRRYDQGQVRKSLRGRVERGVTGDGT